MGGAAPFSLLPEGVGLLLIQLSLVLVVCRALAGVLRRWFKQPTVVAEVLGGILLGKSCAGRIPGYMSTIFPAGAPMATFSTLADFGLCLYLFLVGLELDPPALKRTGRAAMVIAVSGILLPFALGVAVSVIIHRCILAHDPATAHVAPTTLAAFIGVSMSITAFPVLARILAESKLLHSPIGRLVLSAAAFNDGVAWIMLAVTLAMADASQPLMAVYILLATVAWGAFLLLCVRPFLALAIDYVNRTRSRSWRNALLCLVFVCIFISSWFTAISGTDAIFGAFMLGVILPRDEALIRLVERIEDLVVVIFLPMYFTLSGLNTNVASIDSLRGVGILCLVIATAVIGKLVACYLSGLYLGMARRDALAIGICMQTRGLMELIVLGVALKQHILNEEAFSVMVLMAVVSTFLTTPLIRMYYPKSLWEQLPQATAAGALQQQQRATRLRTLSLDRSGAATAAAAAAAGEEGSTAAALLGGSLAVLVPSYDPSKVIAGLYLLLPPPASTAPAPAAPRVTISTFVDAQSTAAVLGERVGFVRDANAREIMLAARFLGADAEAKQVLAPSADVGPQLLQLLHPATDAPSAPSDAFDFVLLPWPGPGEEGSVDFERSMHSALAHTEATFVLLRDRGLPLPRVGPAAAAKPYDVGVLIFGEPQHARDDAALLELAALLHAHRDVRMHVLVYRRMAPQTAELLESLKLGPGAAPAVAASEDGLLALAAGLPLDVLAYSSPAMGEPAGRRHTRGLSGSARGPSAAGRSSLGGSRGLGLRLPSFHHHRRGSSGASAAAAAAARALGGGGATGHTNGTQPLLQDAHGPGGGNGGGPGAAALPTYRAVDDGLSGQPPQQGQQERGPEHAPTPRDVVARLCSRLEGVHGKRVSMMEVYEGRAGDTGAGLAPLQALPSIAGEEEATAGWRSAAAEEGVAIRA